jgi:hypothetical protein
MRARPPSVHLRTWFGSRRNGSDPWPAPSLVLCHARQPRTMLSKPLANPSTLDRRIRAVPAAVTASYVEEHWSPALV